MSTYNSILKNLLNLRASDYANHKRLLLDLQSNIFKSHGHKRAMYAFIQFGNPKATREKIAYKNNLRNWLSNIPVSKAWDQLEERYGGKEPSKSTVGFYLNYEGYKYLEVEEDKIPSSDTYTFRENPQSRLKMAFKFSNERVLPHATSIHGMLMIAGKTQKQCQEQLLEIIGNIPSEIFGIPELTNGTDIVPMLSIFIQNGKKEDPDSFGFNEGLTNPLFFPDQKKIESGLINKKDIASLNTVLVKDPFGRYWNSCGSFLSFLKLEMDAKEFNKQSKALEGSIGGKSSIGKALILGRFSKDMGVGSLPLPKFKFCPAHKSHVSLAKKITETDGIKPIVRRGMNYNDPEYANKGLLFLSFQAEIGAQFESLVNNYFSNSSDENNNIDPLTYPHSKNSAFKFRFPSLRNDNWVGEVSHTFPKPFVYLKRGWYFFAPSISSLKRFKNLNVDLNKKRKNNLEHKKLAKIMMANN